MASRGSRMDRSRPAAARFRPLDNASLRSLGVTVTVLGTAAVATCDGLRNRRSTASSVSRPSQTTVTSLSAGGAAKVTDHSHGPSVVRSCR